MENKNLEKIDSKYIFNLENPLNMIAPKGTSFHVHLRDGVLTVYRTWTEDELHGESDDSINSYVLTVVPEYMVCALKNYQLKFVGVFKQKIEEIFGCITVVEGKKIYLSFNEGHIIEMSEIKVETNPDTLERCVNIYADYSTSEELLDIKNGCLEVANSLKKIIASSS